MRQTVSNIIAAIVSEALSAGYVSVIEGGRAENSALLEQIRLYILSVLLLSERS